MSEKKPAFVDIGFAVSLQLVRLLRHLHGIHEMAGTVSNCLKLQLQKFQHTQSTQ